ncbi:MAG: hypothetical protein ACLSVD_04910 [Eggerthellaceae bacterium]
MKTLWDNYYVPMVQGWFFGEASSVGCGEDGRSSAMWLIVLGGVLPANSDGDDATSYPIQLGALPNRLSSTASRARRSRGWVTKSDEKKNRVRRVPQAVHR